MAVVTMAVVLFYTLALADKKELKCLEILTCAQNIITDMQKALSRRD